MTVLTLGVLIFVMTHLFKRLLPSGRMSLTNGFGEGPAKGLITVALVFAIILMIVGYRAAPYVPLYTPIPGIGYFSLLLLFFAMMLMGMGSSTGRMRSWLRHPMLTGVGVWAVAHLLVNGDLASVILFGGLGIWSIVHRALFRVTEGPWEKPEAGEIKGDIKLVVIAAVIFSVIAGIHLALGVNPFVGTHA